MTRLFINKLTVLDFSFLHPQRGLLGESWFLDLEISGELDDQGMILDFGVIKKQVKGFVDREFDHRLLLPGLHPGCQVTRKAAQTEVCFQGQDGWLIRHESPPDAVCSIPAEGITTESVAQSIRERLMPQLPGNIKDLLIRLYPEVPEGCFYQYSHGLKHHDGQCRRIAHGHRSSLAVLRNGQSAPDLAKDWAHCWHDIYIANREDLKACSHRPDGDYYRFAYSTAEGDFSLELAAKDCYLLDGDTTVENLAQHIADSLHREHPQDHFQVRAFEGIDKGAVGESG
jgi:6-pyruvoyl-tetrahydropterin synthase